MGNYYGRDPVRVRSAPSDEDAALIERIEIDFAIPAWLSVDQQRRLAALVEEVARAPENTPSDGVHWLAGYGVKPVMSDADAALLGRRASGSPPAAGAEPRWESEVLYFETTASRPGRRGNARYPG